MTVRDDAHRLLDEVPDEHLAEVLDTLQRLHPVADRPRRKFRTTGSFEGEHDLGARTKAIVREDWDGRR